MAEDRSLLGAILVRMGAVTLAALQQALDQQKTSEEQLGAILIAQGGLTEAQLDQALAKQAEMRA
jgi:hypothetical protein